MSAGQVDQPAGALEGRYRLEESIGEGMYARTYRGRRVDDGQPVVVKEMRFDQATHWKAIELFEREADILQRLDHPAIPSYLDAFEHRDKGAHRLYFVQQWVDGQTLEQLLGDGFQATEARVRQMAAELLDILAYLHALSPPVIHRDIKPSNIIRGPDGQLHLVDFGAARQVVAASRQGSTVVGTAGYVPAEQLYGDAVAASDLYALGATLVFLVTRQAPANLPAERMKIQFRQAANVSESFARFLDALLEPDVDERLQTVSEAKAKLAAIDEHAAIVAQHDADDALAGSSSSAALSKPADTDIEIHRDNDGLHLVLPRPYIREVRIIGLGGAAVIGLCLFGPLPWVLAFVVGSVTGLVIWSLLSCRTSLKLSPKDFSIRSQSLTAQWGEVLPIERFHGLYEKPVTTRNKLRNMGFERFRWRRNLDQVRGMGLGILDDRGQEFAFGLGLSGAERKWLVSLIGSELDRLGADEQDSRGQIEVLSGRAEP